MMMCDRRKPRSILPSFVYDMKADNLSSCCTYVHPCPKRPILIQADTAQTTLIFVPDDDIIMILGYQHFPCLFSDKHRMTDKVQIGQDHQPSEATMEKVNNLKEEGNKLLAGKVYITHPIASLRGL